MERARGVHQVRDASVCDRCGDAAVGLRCSVGDRVPRALELQRGTDEAGRQIPRIASRRLGAHRAHDCPMLKALALLVSLLLSAGLVFAVGLPALIAFAALALGTVLFSMGGPESCESHDGHSAMGGTTFLVGI